MNFSVCLLRSLRLAGALAALSMPVLAADAPALQLKPASDNVLGAGIKSLLVGGAGVLIVGGCLQVWRKRFASAIPGQSGSGAPVLTASRRISQKTRLLVVHWQGREYLLAENGGSISRIDSIVTSGGEQ